MTSRGSLLRDDHRPIEVSEDGYVSSNACKACHPAQFESWRASYHHTMTRIAAPETIKADFGNRRIGDVGGAPMLLERRGSDFWAEFDDPDWNGASPERPRIKRQVVMVTGSHYQQVYGIGPIAAGCLGSCQGCTSSPISDGFPGGRHLCGRRPAIQSRKPDDGTLPVSIATQPTVGRGLIRFLVRRRWQPRTPTPRSPSLASRVSRVTVRARSTPMRTAIPYAAIGCI